MSDLNENEKNIVMALLAVPLAVFATAVGIPLWGTCYQHVWNWYAPIVSASAPTASFKAAVAASLIVSLIKYRNGIPERAGMRYLNTQLGEEKALATLIRAGLSANILAPLLILGINWVIHLVVHA